MSRLDTEFLVIGSGAGGATTAAVLAEAGRDVVVAEGRCVGGSTEINSGLWHRLPEELAEEWRAPPATGATARC